MDPSGTQMLLAQANTNDLQVAAAIGLLLALFWVIFAVSRWRFGDRGIPFSTLKANHEYGGDRSDVGEQLHTVMSGSFEKRQVLSESEYRLFALVEREVAVRRAGCRVFAHTSLGEILRSDNEDAFHWVNSKRVDILVVDQSGWPLLAIEHQQNGHYQRTALARNAIKREALRSAGVPYAEFCDSDSAEYITGFLSEFI
jgi:hypothetical protein